MSSDPTTFQKNYDRFIERAIKNNRVFGLQSEDGGWAVCPATDEEEATVVMFWSEQADAAKQRKEDWSDYTVTAISLEELMDAWLKGMDEDGSLVGPNWDEDLNGLEVLAVEVAKRLAEE